MLPFPKIFNTHINDVNEILKLYQEMVDKNYQRLTGYSQQPLNTQRDVWMTGSVFNTNGLTNVMYGSPYGTRFSYDSYFCAIFLHAFPDLLTYNFYKANPDTPAYMKLTSNTSYPSYNAVTRNGFTSYSYGSYTGTTSTLFVYIDPVTRKAMQYDPLNKTVPTHYYP